ncbi:MAG TPA: hypothetical protein DC047_11065 [Blastocatellia bacterium]|nr:hypothetical protein [Blastocatellia bacterium]
MDDEVDRRRLAIRRGLRSIYRAACEPEIFAEYGSDLLWCFYFISSTSLDSGLRRLSRRMGKERARRWRLDYRSLPSAADADTIIDYLHGSAAADKFGIADPALNQQIRKALAKLPLVNILYFDPKTEPPPTDATEQCSCGLQNERGRTRCRKCRKQLVRMGRYEVGFYALTRTYSCDGFEAQVGARLADVIKWLPFMRPYRGNENGENPEFYDTVYFVTHVVYTLNEYNTYRLPSRLLPAEFQFLKENLKEAIAMNDPEMVGEFLDSLKAFGLGNTHPLIAGGMDYLLSQQNSDGSWGERDTNDPYLRYHPTWTAIDGLRDYAWREERSSFAELKQLLTQRHKQK